VKTLLWLVLFLIGLTGVALPAVYLHATSKLPQLETEFDVERQLRHSIEGERMSMQAGTFERQPRPTQYQRPEFTRLPKDLVAFYISELGCPHFFQTPPEDGPKWTWRLVSKLVFGVESPGNGACERILSMRLAAALGIPSGLERTVAAHRLHGFLRKDQLIAYELSALHFARGVVGVEDAAWRMFGRELDALQLAELAELALILPPNNLYADTSVCRNASLIRQNRDVLLMDAANHKLITEERARNAMAQPVFCSR
jgi:hypothetical protein